MPQHNFRPLQGRIETIIVKSDALKNNVLGDPTERQVAVYLPPGYDATSDDYPLFVDIVGFTGSGLAHAGWKAFAESVPQRIERLVASGSMGNVIVALPDCFTSLGGNQYVNSSAMGNWADFLTGEMVPQLEATYRVRKGASHRALFGKSSGGYGSIAHAMLYGEHWGAVACHSGDMAFELCYLWDFPDTVMHLGRYNNDIGRFVDELKDRRKMSGGDFHHLMMLAMAATYDPDPNAPYGIQLPLTLDTCEVIEERWQKWLAWDPVVLVDRQEVREQLERSAGIYIDCGSVDQYNLVFGARRLHRKLENYGIDHEYQEFDDNHSSVDYRMDVSLPWLFERVA